MQLVESVKHAQVKSLTNKQQKAQAMEAIIQAAVPRCSPNRNAPVSQFNTPGPLNTEHTPGEMPTVAKMDRQVNSSQDGEAMHNKVPLRCENGRTFITNPESKEMKNTEIVQPAHTEAHMENETVKADTSEMPPAKKRKIPFIVARKRRTDVTDQSDSALNDSSSRAYTFPKQKSEPRVADTSNVMCLAGTYNSANAVDLFPENGAHLSNTARLSKFHGNDESELPCPQETQHRDSGNLPHNIGSNIDRSAACLLDANSVQHANGRRSNVHTDNTEDQPASTTIPSADHRQSIIHARPFKHIALPMTEVDLHCQRSLHSEKQNKMQSFTEGTNFSTPVVNACFSQPTEKDDVRQQVMSNAMTPVHQGFAIKQNPRIQSLRERGDVQYSWAASRNNPAVHQAKVQQQFVNDSARSKLVSGQTVQSLNGRPQLGDLSTEKVPKDCGIYSQVTCEILQGASCNFILEEMPWQIVCSIILNVYMRTN